MSLLGQKTVFGRASWSPHAQLVEREEPDVRQPYVSPRLLLPLAGTPCLPPTLRVHFLTGCVPGPCPGN